jgi:hypothetical protein
VREINPGNRHHKYQLSCTMCRKIISIW